MFKYINSAFALATAAGAIVGIVKNASAMELGAACRTAEEIKNGMTEEGYVPVVIANDADANEARIYYMNPKINTGYLVFSDRSLGTKLTCARVQAKFSQAELVDVRVTQPQFSHNWSKDAAYANKACDAIGKRECGFFDDRLNGYAKRNLFTYFRGVTNQRSPDGQASGDILLTVLGGSSDAKAPSRSQMGKILGTFATGMTMELFNYSYVEYTGQGVKILDEKK